jgi:hypothetical protein
LFCVSFWAKRNKAFPVLFLSLIMFWLKFFS